MTIIIAICFKNELGVKEACPEHALSDNSNISVNFFGLNAQRNAIGFRSNRVSQVDSYEERDLIKGDFNNFGIEARWLKKYILGNKKAVFLLGGKYYSAKNTSAQGPGSASNEADFSFYNEEYTQIVVNKETTGGNDVFTVYAKEGFNERLRTNVSSSLVVPGVSGWTSGSELKFGGSTLTASIDEIRLWRTPLNESRIDNHALLPDAIDGNHISSSTTDLILFVFGFFYNNYQKMELTQDKLSEYELIKKYLLNDSTLLHMLLPYYQ